MDKNEISIETIVAIAVGVPTLLIALLALWIGYLTWRQSREPGQSRSSGTFSMLPMMAYGMAGLSPAMLPMRPRAARLRGQLLPN